jgi:hypothetical protein
LDGLDRAAHLAGEVGVGHPRELGAEDLLEPLGRHVDLLVGRDQFDLLGGRL